MSEEEEGISSNEEDDNSSTSSKDEMDQSRDKEVRLNPAYYPWMMPLIFFFGPNTSNPEASTSILIRFKAVYDMCIFKNNLQIVKSRKCGHKYINKPLIYLWF